ncbi:hypothetical protein BH10CYA1_BH10CYA1_25970 [soil metagenome]
MAVDTKTQSLKGTYPLSNPAFNVIALLYEKSKALEAYDRYLEDLKDDKELTDLFTGMRAEETKQVEQLKNHLARLLKAESTK